MNDKEKPKNQDPVPPDKQETVPPVPREIDSPEEQDEEIIFPKTDETNPDNQSNKPRKLFSPLKILALVLLGIGVYFAGYLTSPENFTKTMDQMSEWFSASREMLEPYKEKLTQAIESKVKKKEAEPPTPTIKDGDKISPKDKRKIKYWKAPMDPTYVRDKPGKGPMGMDMVPVYEDELGGQIKINPIVVQNIGVKTEKVKRRTLRHKIRTVGNLTYDERKVHHVHTKYGGWIEKLHVDFTGQEVKKGDLLLEIYSPDLVSTQEELVLALKYQESLKDSAFGELSKSADSLVESTKKRLKLFDVPDHQVEELIRSKNISKTMHIHSPARGFVLTKKAQQGMHVQPGMSLYSIADLSNIWVLADIYEYEVPWIKVGQFVEMNLSYFPGKKFKGKVTFIDPFLDPTTRTLKVRMEFSNPKWQLKPDMYANVTIQSTVAKRGLTVSEEAVLHSGEKNLVIVATDSGQFESREITLGVQAGGYYQVLKGLRNGEKVVTSSHFLIDSESKLREAIEKFQKVAPAPSMKPGKKKKPPEKAMPKN